MKTITPTIQKKADFQKNVRRFFDEELWDPFSFIKPLFSKELEFAWMPKLDVIESKKAITMKLDVPNVKPEDINIEVNDISLTVNGHTEKEEEDEGKTWYRYERESGNFQRTIPLPNNVDLDNISAEDKNGTLLIKLPKLKESPSRKIKVMK